MGPGRATSPTKLADGLFRVLDLKVLDPLGSTEGDVRLRGAFVGFGNTHEEGSARVFGRLQRGVPSDGAFVARTGAGYVAPVKGDYDRAQQAGVELDLLLVEPSGACGPRLRELLKQAAEARDNKLTSSEYDETTWAARSWLTFVRQRISCAIVKSGSQRRTRLLRLWACQSLRTRATARCGPAAERASGRAGRVEWLIAVRGLRACVSWAGRMSVRDVRAGWRRCVGALWSRCPWGGPAALARVPARCPPPLLFFGGHERRRQERAARQPSRRRLASYGEESWRGAD